MLWDKYNPNDFSENSYSIIPEGPHRVRIENAVEKVSHAGNNMIELTLAVSGYSSKLWSYIVLNDSSEDAIRRTNKLLGSVFNSFSIEPPVNSDIDIRLWVGQTGGAMVRHKTDANGRLRAEVHYFLNRFDVDNTLPEWGVSNSQPLSSQQKTEDNYNLNPAEIPF